MAGVPSHQVRAIPSVLDVLTPEQVEQFVSVLAGLVMSAADRCEREGVDPRTLLADDVPMCELAERITDVMLAPVTAAD